MFSYNLSVNLRDVLLFSRKAGQYHTNPRDFSSLAYRLKADGAYLCDGKRFSYSANSISFVPADTAYDQCEEEADAIVFHFDAFGHIPDGIEIYAFDNYEPFRALFYKALEIWNEKRPGYKYRATAVFYEILSAMQAGLAASSEPDGGFAERAKEYIDAHFSDPALSIQQLAERAYVSSAYFRRRFAQLYRLSPKQYLDFVRFQYAVSLLHTGYYTQAEVAARCGYSDVKYFRSKFKAKTGESISKYCKSHGI